MVIWFFVLIELSATDLLPQNDLNLDGDELVGNEDYRFSNHNQRLQNIIGCWSENPNLGQFTGTVAYSGDGDDHE